jgi:hypothetical protein
MLEVIKTLDLNKEYTFSEVFPSLHYVQYEMYRKIIQREYREWVKIDLQKRVVNGCEQQMYTITRVKATFKEKMKKVLDTMN